MRTGRPTARAPRAMVAAAHPLATVAGLEILRAGGNAIDAGLAVNAVLDVTQPHCCGFGGDGFILFWEAASGRLHAYNASGRAAALATPERLRELGHERMPLSGPLAANVPGIADGWWQLHQRFGALPWRECWQPAVGYARDGYPVSQQVASAIAASADLFRRWAASADTFLPGGRPPAPGQRFRQPNLARSFELLAEHGAEVYYRGELGAAIADAVEAAGGLLRRDDFAAHHGDWTEPVGLRYRGLDVFVHGPNSQGWTLPYMLGLVADREIPPPAGIDAIHLGVEAKRLAFADRDAYNTDPAAMTLDVRRLLDERYLAGRRSLLGPRAAEVDPHPGTPDGDTTYFCLVDQHGNALSVIQSLYHGFGCKFVAGDTGIVLQNRGAYFSLDPGHPNLIAPRKRTAHTLVAAMVLRDGRPAIVPGSMGGDGQPQILYQILTAMIDHGLEPQEAIELPRWVHGGTVQLEPRTGEGVIAGLEALGHQVTRLDDWAGVCGHAQVIRIDEHGLHGGADPRGDGLAAGF